MVSQQEKLARAQQSAKDKQNNLSKTLSNKPSQRARRRSRPNPPNPIPIKGLAKVKHSEYVGDVVATQSAFSITQQFTINPGANDLFIWLSSVAQSYDKYKFTYLAFRYVTENNQPQSGVIMLYVDYDVDDPLPTNKQVMLTSDTVSRCAPHQKTKFVCQPKDLVRKLYVNGGTQAGLDKKELHLGQFIIATQGITALNSTLGELWVDYAIELEHPTIEKGLGNSAQMRFMCNGLMSNNMSTTPVTSGTQQLCNCTMPLCISQGCVQVGGPGKYIVDVDMWCDNISNQNTTPQIKTLAPGSSQWQTPQPASYIKDPNGGFSKATFVLDIVGNTLLALFDTIVPGAGVVANIGAVLRIANYLFA